MPTKKQPAKQLTPAEVLRRELFADKERSGQHPEADRLRCLHAASPGPLSPLQRRVIDAYLGGTKDPEAIARQLGIEPKPTVTRDRETSERISAHLKTLGEDVPADALEGPLPAPPTAVEVVFRKLIAPQVRLREPATNEPTRVAGLSLRQRRVLDVCLYLGKDGRPQAKVGLRKKLPSPESVAAALGHETKTSAKRIMDSLESFGALGVSPFVDGYTEAHAEADLKASGAWRNAPPRRKPYYNEESIDNERARHETNQRMVAARKALQKSAFTPGKPSEAERIMHAQIADELGLSPDIDPLDFADEQLDAYGVLYCQLHRDSPTCQGCGQPIVAARRPGDPYGYAPSGRRKYCSDTCGKRVQRAGSVPL